MQFLIGTPENPDILDYLDSGLDNVERNEARVELGGILLTMKEAAAEIRRLREAVRIYELKGEKN